MRCFRPPGITRAGDDTIPSGDDGNGPRAIAAESRDAEMQPFAAPKGADTSVAEIAILLRVSRNAVYEWSLLEDDPLPLKRMMGRKRGRFAFRDELLEWSKRHAT